MSHHVYMRRDDYLKLLHEFASGACDGRDFVMRFLELRRRDLDADAGMKAKWSEPLDEKLLAALRRGEITDEEFTRRWHELWQYPRGDPWLDAFAAVFTQIERFEPDDQLRWRDRDQALVAGTAPRYVDEEELRSHVRQAVERLKTSQE